MISKHKPVQVEPMRAYYAARASEYDRVYQKPERQGDLATLRAWLPTLFTGSTLLEIACGTGYWTQFIAPAASNVLAFDIASETLAIAKARVSHAHVSFVTADAYHPPRDHGKFNAGFAGFWFSHVPVAQRRAFFSGLATVLEPGARVVLLDNLYIEGSSTPPSETDADGNTYQTRLLENRSTHRVLKNFPAEAELHAAIVNSGRDGGITRFNYFWVFEFFVESSQPC